MNLIFFGPPGAGKGTQAELLSELMGIPSISTGNIIREEVASESDFGLQLKSCIDKGQLVADEIMLNIIKLRLSKPDCVHGFILDGFPRTVAQAKGLKEMGIVIDKVINIEVDDDLLVGRLGGRRVCIKCGASYHLENNPSEAGDRCDKCGELLVVRDDDREEIVRERLRVFHENTKPVEDYYRNIGSLVSIDGSDSIGGIAASIAAIVRG